MKRGEIRLCRFGPPDKRRPALILTRESSIRLLNSVTVVPITSTRRGVSTELALGTEQGLKHDSAANFHNLMTIHQSDVGVLVATLSDEILEKACRAVSLALGCDEISLH